MDELRQAAVAEVTPAPSGTPAPTGDPAAPAAPATPAEPPYVTTTLPDGKLEVKLRTGQRFVADNALDLSNKLASSRVDAEEYFKGKRDFPDEETIRAKLPHLFAPPASPVQAVAQAQLANDLQQAATPDAQQAAMQKFYQTLATDPFAAIKMAVEQSMPEQVQLLQSVRDQQVVTQQNQIIDQFLAKHPELPVSEHTFGLLGDLVEKSGAPLSVQALEMANAYAVMSKQYTPLTPEQIQQSMLARFQKQTGWTPPIPAPTIASQGTAAANAVSTSDPYKMDMTELRKAALAEQNR